VVAAGAEHVDRVEELLAQGRRLPLEYRRRLAHGLLEGVPEDGTAGGAELLAPDGFSWRGRVVTGLSPLQFRLLQVLVDGHRLRDFVPLGEVAAHVWAGRSPPQYLPAALKELIRRTWDRFHLATPRVPLVFERKRGRLRLWEFGRRGSA
jgi:hypothetical protein